MRTLRREAEFAARDLRCKPNSATSFSAGLRLTAFSGSSSRLRNLSMYASKSSKLPSVMPFQRLVAHARQFLQPSLRLENPHQLHEHRGKLSIHLAIGVMAATTLAMIAPTPLVKVDKNGPMLATVVQILLATHFAITVQIMMFSLYGQNEVVTHCSKACFSGRETARR